MGEPENGYPKNQQDIDIKKKHAYIPTIQLKPTSLRKVPKSLLSGPGRVSLLQTKSLERLSVLTLSDTGRTSAVVLSEHTGGF